MSERIEGISSMEDLEALREQQASEVKAMGFYECKSVWNGFPPACSILNPASLKEQVALEGGAGVDTPMAKAAQALEATYGPQQSAPAGRSEFNASAGAPERNPSENIASLTFSGPGQGGLS